MIRVINKYQENDGISVMRPSPLGNPYSHMEGTSAQFKVATREEAVEKYKHWLVEQVRANNTEVVYALIALFQLAVQGDLILRCCCVPKACHASVIKMFLEAQLKRPENQIFVFGSNLQGNHGAGAARTAATTKGAKQGQAQGLQGMSYAIPTCNVWDRDSRKYPGLTSTEIRDYVADFIMFASHRPELQFKVTRVGCGLAGLSDHQIAKMFISAPDNCLFDEKWKFWLPHKKFWGTYP